MQRLWKFADQLERKAAPVFNPSRDGKGAHSNLMTRPVDFLSATAPDSIDDMLLELEDLDDARDFIRSITPVACGWLALALREKIAHDEERMSEEVARDLDVRFPLVNYKYRLRAYHFSQTRTQIACPPRNVRSFRIVLVKDAHTIRRPAQRQCQITVWDVLSLQLVEDDRPGDFKPGQRLLVSI